MENNCAVGFFYQPDGKSFCRVWSPLSKKLELIILSPIERTINLHKEKNGYWYASVPDATPGTEYLLRPDGKKALPDPASLLQPHSVHGVSAVIDLQAYRWQDQEWKGIELKDMIIYELHTGTFSGSGTFEGMRQKLDYLLELGVNTLEIMPIAQFPGTKNWGYDGVFPFSVQNSYGSPDDLKRLIDEAHQKGIAVILDVVYNHFGPEGSYHDSFGPYTTEKYKTPWAKALNFDDKYADGVREYFWQNALMWLNDYHFDGLRLDAVHAIWDFGAVHFMDELRKRVRALERETGRKKVLIAEIDLNNPKYINDPSIGGFGLDGQWSDEFHHAIHSFLTGETNGYYEDFGELSDLEKVIRDSYVYTGQFSKHRKKKFGVLPKNPYHQFVVFAQNHDQIGNRMLGERLRRTLAEKLIVESKTDETTDSSDEIKEAESETKTLSKQKLKEAVKQSSPDNQRQLLDMLKLAAATVLLSPHVPLLFMGEEYGEENPFQFFTDYTDPELIKNTREGRKKEFESFGWDAELPDPVAQETFEQCKLSFNVSDPFNKEVFETYKHFIQLRKSHAAFQSTERSDMTVHDASHENLIVFDRNNGNDKVRVILNYSNESQNYSNYQSTGKIIYDSSKTSSQNEVNRKSSEDTSIKPWSILIIELT